MRMLAALSVVTTLVVGTGVSAQEADRDLYAAALARERTVRTTLTGSTTGTCNDELLSNLNQDRPQRCGLIPVE